MKCFAYKQQQRAHHACYIRSWKIYANDGKGAMTKTALNSRISFLVKCGCELALLFNDLSQDL